MAPILYDICGTHKDHKTLQTFRSYETEDEALANAASFGEYHGCRILVEKVTFDNRDNEISRELIKTVDYADLPMAEDEANNEDDFIEEDILDDITLYPGDTYISAGMPVTVVEVHPESNELLLHYVSYGRDYAVNLADFLSDIERGFVFRSK